MEVSIDLNTDRSENVQYNNTEFPVYVRRELLSIYPNYSAASHWHDDVELVVVLTGYMLYNVNGNIVTLNQGQGIFVNARQIHFGYSDHNSECEFICVILHPVLLCTSPYIEQKYITPIIANNSFSYCVLHETEKWENNILESVRLMNDWVEDHSFPLQIQSLFYRIWTELYNHAPKEQKLPGKRTHQLTALKDMMEYIQRNYKSKIALDDIAVAGKVCKSNCCSIFRDYLKQTPIGYLTDYRLKRSIDLMNSTDMTIAEISYEVGFSGASYYTETFRRYYGSTPVEFRAGQKIIHAF